MATTPAKRACSVCGTLLADDSPFCPVCAFQQALGTQTYSDSNSSSELRFEHYTVLKNAEGKPFELGRGAMGVTYKAFDVHLQRPAALKIINAQLFGNESARARFIREARAAASVRHQNVASVFHIGESGGNYYYAMELVEGESLAALIRRSGRLRTDLALEILEHAAAGLAAIEKQHLVHRDIKPSNIMVSLQDGKLENVKIIDLGLAKGVAEEHTLSTVGAFVGTPAYASPEQFAGISTDIRSDLYSLGVTLWEMLSGKLPFSGSAAELMYRHQHAEPPIEKLKSVSAPVIALLRVLLAKDPNQRGQTPAQLQHALMKIRGASASGSRLTADELRSAAGQVTLNLSKGKPSKLAVRWVVAVGLCLSVVIIAFFFLTHHSAFLLNQRAAQAAPTEKSIAVLPFENISPNKDDAYFADGVQDEILNNLAKIAQLKVISRTSVMQYRADTKRDLRQIATALGVANVLEGTVRRDGNHVRVSTELVDARNDSTIWADSYDRDLSDIFAIQSEIAQTIAAKLTARLSAEEKRHVETKPTENLEAYDLYLRAKELFVSVRVSMYLGNVEEQLVDAIGFLEQALRLDPKFALAYCASAHGHDNLYFLYRPTPEQRALADAAVNRALNLQPDLAEVHLAYAEHLYLIYRDYERARAQLAIAMRGLPNDAEAIALGARIDRRQGQFEKAIGEFNDAITRDPGNPTALQELADTLYYIRRFRPAERVFDRLTVLRPDLPILKARKPLYVGFYETGDDTAVLSTIAALPASISNDRGVLSLRLKFALVDRDWQQARQLIEKMNGDEDEGWFAYGGCPVPVGCYSIVLARLQGEPSGRTFNFAETREQLSQKAEESSGMAALMLSQLAVVDAFLGNKEAAISEANRAAEMTPISKDVFDGLGIAMNLAVVYAWTDEADLAFQKLELLTKMLSASFMAN